jgi:hypothetical protein
VEKKLEIRFFTSRVLTNKYSFDFVFSATPQRSDSATIGFIYTFITPILYLSSLRRSNKNNPLHFFMGPISTGVNLYFGILKTGVKIYWFLFDKDCSDAINVGACGAREVNLKSKLNQKSQVKKISGLTGVMERKAQL